MEMLKKSNFESMARKNNVKKIRISWDDDSRYCIDPEEEVRKAFTQMTDEQLQFHLQIPGKNRDYAEALLNYRNKKNM